MKNEMTIQEIDEKILQIKQQLLELGLMHPGHLSSQYHVCGKPGCKCTATDPQPHGPYCKLNYVYHGKSTCRFVRADVVEEVTAMVATFKTFRQLTDQWVALSIARAKLGPFALMERKRKSPATPPTKPSKRRKPTNTTSTKM